MGSVPKGKIHYSFNSTISLMYNVKEGVVMKQQEKHLRTLEAIASIHQAVGANLDLKAICKIIAEKIVEITGADGAAILIFRDGYAEVLAEVGFRKKFEGKRLELTMPAINYILNTGNLIFTGELEKSVAATCIPSGCGMKSLICVPIIIKDRIRGIVHLDAAREDAFDREDLELVKMLAGEIAIIMERTFLYEEIKEMSIKDPLTGVYNRRKLEEDLNHEVSRAKRYNRNFSILMIDVDWFKKYNDTHGHQKGDELLKRIVEILKSCLRASDRIYRYGGEEFVVLLPETPRERAYVAAERLRKRIEQEKFFGAEKSQPEGKVTISIGVAGFPDDGKNWEEILRKADSALYRAKEEGRNRVVLA